MVIARHEFEPVLVEVSNLSQELTVGVGCATATVRTLSNVSLTVRPRELVVLTGSRGAGERALLAVIGGDRRGVSGSCTLNAHTNVRVIRISRTQAAALTRAWASVANAPSPERCADAWSVREYPTTHATLNSLYLLNIVESDAPRARHTASTVSIAAPDVQRNAVSEWAATCYRRGGAVIIAAGHALGVDMFSEALRHTQNPQPRHAVAAVRESHPPSTRSAVRVVVMSSGRMAPPVVLNSHDLNPLKP